MSIPKEPRQLMINIMYLVLTAMLALNVSAQIFNAFKVIDKSLMESNQSVDNTNKNRVESIKTAAKKDIATFQTYVDRIPQVQKLSSEFSSYIDDIKKYMIDATDGYDEEGHLKGKKNKDITTRYLVNEGKGAELKAKIQEFQSEMEKMIDQGDRGGVALPIKIDDETWKSDKEHNAKSWAEFNFKQMPLQSVLPLLSKIQNDIKLTEAEVLNYYQKKVGGEEITFDKFHVVAAPKNSYVIKGETYEADIFLSATSKNPEGLTISINGNTLPIEEGIATYKTNTSTTGIKKYKAVATLTNAVTGQTDTYEETFEYEVGERSVAVSADKMNVFYIGVDNPVTISAAGVPSEQLKVSATGATITPKGGSAYNVTVKEEGEAVITVSGGGLEPTKNMFRVKRIPNPVAKIGGKNGGAFGTGELRVQNGVYAELEDFDFDTNCKIVGFDFVYMPARSDAIPIPVNGTLFNSQVKEYLEKIKPGDRVSIENIQGKCPGDQIKRDLGQMIFRIK